MPPVLTPAAVESVRPGSGGRSVRLIVDHGGLFVSVDGDGPLQRELVGAVLDAAVELCAPGASRMGPAIAPFGRVPLCHGSILGTLREGARAALVQIVARAGYTVG